MKERKSNLELLRIISMFLIVIHHFAVHGSEIWANHFHQNYVQTENIYLLLLSFGKAAVVAFVLIGAYFLSEKQFKLSRIVNLCLNTLIYSWLIYLILFFIDPKLVAQESGVNLWLPIPIPSNYWFVIAYVYMLIMMPLVNYGLRKCNKRQLLFVILLLFFFWCILQFIPNNKLDNSDYNFYTTNNYFLFIYVIGGFIRKYNLGNNLIKSFLLLIVFLLVLEIIILVILGSYSKNYDFLWGILANNNSPFGILIGIPLFLTFKNLNIGYNRIINYISKSMFGVYLIHDNSFVRSFLWKKIVKTAPIANKPGKYLQYGLTISFFTFCICICIDIFKRIVMDPLINKVLKKYTQKFLIWLKE